jgi:hypothetical protein
VHVLPKTSPFSNQMLGTSTNNSLFVLNENKQTPYAQVPVSSAQTSTAKIISQKQITYCEIGMRMLRRKIDFQLFNVNQQLLKSMNARSEWNDFSHQIANDVRMLIERKVTLQQRVNSAKTQLAKKIG